MVKKWPKASSRMLGWVRDKEKHNRDSPISNARSLDHKAQRVERHRCAAENAGRKLGFVQGTRANAENPNAVVKSSGAQFEALL